MTLSAENETASTDFGGKVTQPSNTVDCKTAAHFHGRSGWCRPMALLDMAIIDKPRQLEAFGNAKLFENVAEVMLHGLFAD
jgi:hypothetical protein